MRLDDSELDGLLAPMRDGPVALSGAAEGAARRQRLLPGVRAAVQAAPARARRTRRLHRTYLGATACGVLVGALVWLGTEHAAEPQVAPAVPLYVEALGNEAPSFVDARGTTRTLTGDAPIAETGELRAAASSWSRVLTSEGARVELAPSARLRITRRVVGGGPAPTTELELTRGEAHCSVPKLGAGAQFSIATPDARVVVHGTVFSVKVGEAGAGPRTCVRVNEGLVEVRHEGSSRYLRPGMHWGCEPAAPSPLAAAGAAPEPPMATAAPTAAPEPMAARSRPNTLAARRAARGKASGTLARETALLAAALAAEREGERDRARGLFSELLGKHPRSPLVPEARAGAARNSRARTP
jgi:hypothetical protein